MLAFAAMGLHLLAMLKEQGFAPEKAALLAALVGPMQVAGRDRRAHLRAPRGPARTGEIALLAFPVAARGPCSSPAQAPRASSRSRSSTASSNGVMTIVRGTVPAEIWGREGYGGLTGLMATPVLLARAAGPFAAAGILALAGGYRTVLLGLIAVSILSWAAFAMAVRGR